MEGGSYVELSRVQFFGEDFRLVQDSVDGEQFHVGWVPVSFEQSLHLDAHLGLYRFTDRPIQRGGFANGLDQGQ